MFDLGTSFLASTARDPDAIALVDGDLRLTYAEWFARISAVASGLSSLGMRRGQHLVSLLQNRMEAATLHWACQFIGVIITPLNWRSTSEEVEYCLTDATAAAVVYEDVCAEAVAGAKSALSIPRIRVGTPQSGEIAFSQLEAASSSSAVPRAGAEDWSLMLYTSGTTSRPKGVPRRHRMERAAAIAHVAQNLYRRGERTLGVMPLYHTMGV